MPETLTPAFPDRATPLLSYGLPFTEALPRHADALFHASRIYVICSGSLARNTGYLDDLKQKLGGKLAGARIGMKPHSHWDEILSIVAEARACDADLLVTLGGGSLTDAAKVVSLALANSVSSPTDLAALLPPSSPPLPLSPAPRPPILPSHIPIASIPTSLSGGEYSPFAGATDPRTGHKRSFSGPALRAPSLVILDPTLTTTTPMRVWLSTGVKGLDHCVETLCSLAGDGRAEAEADAGRGLGGLVGGLLGCAREGKPGRENEGQGQGKGEEEREGKGKGKGKWDLEARLQCQLGVRDAMAACSRGVPLGASHGIGHQLGPAGVGHGETSCVLLPAVCAFNYARDANRARQDAVAEMLWGLDDDDKDYNDEMDGDVGEKGEREGATTTTGVREVFERRGLRRGQAQLGDLLDAVIRELGLPRTLAEFGIGEEKLEAIAEHSLQDRWVKTNPAPLDKEGVLEILRMVLQ
ncbi:putative Fe-containing alcohol dehydrogenase [Whalleya microplaca]|nr:putative Fe-containing alcohol dehydrogenase [Whalleya microplaca]